jgi:hypothetical protein
MNQLKRISSAIAVALALTGVLASPASAQFTSNKEHTIISGTQKAGTNDNFTAGEGFGGITCANATFSGTKVNKSESTMTITPVYENCIDSFGRTVHTHTTETQTWTTGAGGGLYHRSGSKTLTITSGGTTVCTVSFVMPQTDNGLTYHNLGGTAGVEVIVNTTNVRTTTSGGFFNCGVSNGEHTTGTVTGHDVFTGKDTAGAAAEISVD